MTGTPMQVWVAKLCYPGRKPFAYGTITVRHGAPHEEVRKEAIASLMEHLPAGTAEPEVLELMRGHVVFVPSEPEP